MTLCIPILVQSIAVKVARKQLLNLINNSLTKKIHFSYPFSHSFESHSLTNRSEIVQIDPESLDEFEQLCKETNPSFQLLAQAICKILSSLVTLSHSNENSAPLEDLKVRSLSLKLNLFFSLFGSLFGMLGGHFGGIVSLFLTLLTTRNHSKKH